MHTSKEDITVYDSPMVDGEAVDKELDDAGIPSKYRGTAADKKDMTVLGKKQVLRVCLV